MNNLISNTFQTISILKNINKETLILDDDDNYYIKEGYNIIKKYKRIKFKLWKKIVINYSIETMNDIYTSVDILTDEIIKKYKT